MNFWQKIIHRSDRKSIYNAFPKSLKKDVEKVIAILPFNDHNSLGADGETHHVDDLVYFRKQIIYLDKEMIKIPYRIYLNEPAAEEEKKLTGIQKTILYCIYSRHHNGFVRQRRLEQLLDNTEYFVVPFVFHLLGEYVLEIIEVLQHHINTSTIDNYVKFINENKKYWKKTECRMISYWSAYYRHSYLGHMPKYTRRKDYIGQQIVDRLKKELDNRAMNEIGIQK